tara:strand:+ start:489 stop:1211 length:723 start_codon:yes stop_codon:yes gene_type:complete
MARNQTTQRARTASNPLLVGTFDQTSIRYLTGQLGGTHVPGPGGYGGGTVNHWFKFKIETNAWIILAKGGGWEKWFNVSAYDINKNPIQGRGIFDDDSITITSDGEILNPYIGHVMGAQSDLYNNFDSRRLDKGDSRYYPLEIGEYLICVSSNLNTPFNYAVGVVIEMADPYPVLLTEDYDRLLLETVATQDDIICDTTPNYTGAEDHEHSLTEWKTAWSRERQAYEKFPDVLVPLTTKP